MVNYKSAIPVQFVPVKEQAARALTQPRFFAASLRVVRRARGSHIIEKTLVLRCWYLVWLGAFQFFCAVKIFEKNVLDKS